MIHKDKKMLGILASLVCQFFWGFSFLFTKKITDTVPVLSLLSWRFIFAFAAMNFCVMTRLIKVDFRKKSLSTPLLMAVFHPILYFIGETVGVNLTTASETGAIIACIPIITILFSALILKDRPTKHQIIGVSIASVGILMLVVLKGLEASFSPAGYLMLFLSVISYSLYAVFSQKADGLSIPEKTYIMMAAGAVSFTALALIQSGSNGTFTDFLTLPIVNFDFLFAVLYLAIGCSVAAFLFYNAAIVYIGTNRAASFAGLSTIIAEIAGVIILKEKFTAFQGIGAALVIAGVYLANIIPKANKLDTALKSL